ncbi:putative udp-glucose flavonoid 3-o-glucosyltransferase 3 [Fagus crenata]
MKTVELMFIPSPSIGHLVSMVELAKIFSDRDDRLMIKVFIMKLSFDTKVSAYIESLNSSSITNRIQFIDLPQDEGPSTAFSFTSFIENKKPQIKDIVSKRSQSESGSNSPPIAAFVIDIFCTTMIDVANEFGIPAYIYFTSSAAVLGLMFHLQTLHDDHNQDIAAYKDSDTELVVPSFVNTVPARVLPLGF